MPLDPISCYRALVAHDARFDGRFFVGVASTGIYCRPVCAVRTPRRENCRFFGTAAAAEAAGFRPCLRCRPELAPGCAAVDSTQRLAHAAIALIEDGALERGGVEALAAPLGITPRHLRRVFDHVFGVSPVAYAQTHRLLLAKRLLTDTALPVTEVAFASGFGSVRRFNACFSERYRMPPARLRRKASAVAEPQPLRFELPYRPPYDWSAMLEFLEARAIARVEEVSGERYRRSLAISHEQAMHRGWIAVGPVRSRPALAVEVSPSLARVVVAVLRRTRHAFDTSCDPAAVAAALGELAAAAPGLRLPGSMDGFELAVRAIVGQQISVRAARTLLARLVDLAGEDLPNPTAGIDRVFPSPEAIIALGERTLAGIGVTRSRVRTLMALAREVAHGRLSLDPSAEIGRTMAALRAIPGIGPWTTEVIAMRALGWPDAFPANDGPLLRAMGEARGSQALAASAQWHPWRSYAVMHLWRRSAHASNVAAQRDAAR